MAVWAGSEASERFARAGSLGAVDGTLRSGIFSPRMEPGLRRRLLPFFSVLLAASPALGETWTLEECRETARLQHPEAAISRSLTAAAAARRAIAFSGFLPRASAQGSFLVGRGTGGSSLGVVGTDRNVSGSGAFFGPADFEIWTANLSLQQTVWDFGRTLNRYRLAQAEARRALAQQQLAEELVDVAAEAAFRTALAADELVAAMTESLRQAKAHLSLARGRAEVGMAAPYDVSRAEVEVAQAEVRVIQAENGRELALAQLAIACGLDALPEGVTLGEAPPRAIPELPSLEAALEEAMEALPEMRAARAAVEAAERAYDASLSELYPSFDLSGTASLRGREFDDLRPGWTAVASLSVPLLNGGGDLARIREQRALLATAQAEFIQLRRALRLDLETALLAVQEASARLAAAEAMERSAAQGLSLAEGRYQTGLGSALELADAQSQLANARAERVQSALDLSISLARLERLLGRWSSG